MRQAHEMMTSDVVAIKPYTPILQATRMLAEHNVTGFPVVDDKNMLLGILSEKDVLQLFATEKSANDEQVKDFMTQPAIYFEATESIEAVCECLRSYDFRRVPITRNGRLVGIVTRRDIITHMLPNDHNCYQHAKKTSQEKALTRT